MKRRVCRDVNGGRRVFVDVRKALTKEKKTSERNLRKF